VTAFQVWNEPNLSLYLSPQYSRNRAVAPELYRRMLNAFYAGVKSVNAQALVVSAGTAPFGDPPGGSRIPPVVFWRDLLCLRQVGAQLRRACSTPAHFDVMAHHPYSVGSPSTKALNAGDVSIPDLGKLTKLLQAGERAGTVLPRESHPLWITETSYNSFPPAPGGVPINQQARWLEQAFSELWREGAQAIFWEQVGDQPPVPSYGATNQSGVYFVSGKPKPAAQAFEFPLVAWRATSSAIEIWGRAPAAGQLVLERQSGSAWRTVRVLNEKARATFLTQIAARGALHLRARIGDQTSLVWNLG
jgi:hypothetical protein